MYVLKGAGRLLDTLEKCILKSRLEKIEAAKLPLWVDYGQYTTHHT